MCDTVLRKFFFLFGIQKIKLLNQVAKPLVLLKKDSNHIASMKEIR